MGYLELIEKLRALSREKQAEVFDFVEFLRARSSGMGRSDHPTDIEFSEFSMGHALRGMEDDPVTYTEEDLSEKWT
jgi:hypothetical protein